MLHVILHMKQGEKVELWSEDIGELCGSLQALYIAFELHLKQQQRE